MKVRLVRSALIGALCMPLVSMAAVLGFSTDGTGTVAGFLPCEQPLSANLGCSAVTGAGDVMADLDGVFYSLLFNSAQLSVYDFATFEFVSNSGTFSMFSPSTDDMLQGTVDSIFLGPVEGGFAFLNTYTVTAGAGAFLGLTGTGEGRSVTTFINPQNTGPFSFVESGSFVFTVPEPATALIFSAGLLGMRMARRRTAT